MNPTRKEDEGVSEEPTDEEMDEFDELHAEWVGYQDNPGRDRGEVFQDRYDMYRNEY